MSIPTGRLGLLALSGALLAGCVPQARVVLLQPEHPPAQQRLQLSSDWAYYDPDNSDRQALLLAFPRPAEKRGARDFLVYIEAPSASEPPGFPLRLNSRQRFTITAPDTGTPASGPADPAYPQTDGRVARAFLVQAVGEFRGRTDFTSGTLDIRADPARPRRLLLILDLQAPGVTLRGEATAAPDAAELARFARRYAGDVATLHKPPPANRDDDLNHEP